MTIASPDFLTTAFVQTYSTNVEMLLQQKGSRLRPAVMNQANHGMAASVAEQFGSVNAVKNTTRHANTPLINVPQDRRWMFPADYDWADLIDNQDKLRLLIDPQSPYAMAGAMALGRAQDDVIIDAFFNTAQTGQTGVTNTSFLSGNIVAHDVGGTSGTGTGLNVAKLRAAKKILMKAEVDLDNDPLFIAITADQHDDLLNEVQVTNLDFTNKPVLVEGKITSFMGFNFIHSERLPGAPNYAGALTPATSEVWLPCWAKSGMAFGSWNEIQTSIAPRVDKRNSMQVYVTGTFGATRLQEPKVVQINCLG
jgi:hypothetical protein